MKRTVFVTTLLACLVIATVAFANEPEGGHHAVFTAENVKNYGLRMANFVLFAYLLYKFLGKKVRDFFVGRRDGIKQDLDNLQTRQADAEKKLKEVEAGIANMAKEKEAILAQAREQGEVIKVAIITKAQKDAEALTEQAKRTAANEAQAAMDRIRSEMADMVVAAAEKVFAEKLSAEDHDKLVDEYLTKVVLN